MNWAIFNGGRISRKLNNNGVLKYEVHSFKGMLFFFIRQPRKIPERGYLLKKGKGVNLPSEYTTFLFLLPLFGYLYFETAYSQTEKTIAVSLLA